MKKSLPDGRPAVDDHFLCEDAGVEVVKGRLLVCEPAAEPHGIAHFSLAYVLGAHVAEGFLGAVDMLTRTGHDSNFAPDASVFPAARDPVTGGRQLEELAFEIADSQPLDSAGDKARELVRRGVRRVFCVVVRHRRVLEWSPETDTWSPLPDTAVIEDRCFVRPLPVGALHGAAAGDEAVIAALLTRGSAALRNIETRAKALGKAEGRAEGKAEGKAEALLTVLSARAFYPTDALVARIRSADAAEIDRWLARVVTARSMPELFAED